MKGDFQNGSATDFSKKAEGNGEGEASQCRASPGTKSVLSVRPCFGVPLGWKVRRGYDS